MSSPFVDFSQDWQALRMVLERLRLIEEGQPFEALPLTGGVSSTILKITSGPIRFCAKQALPKLKVAKDWHVPTDRVFGEIDWLTTVAAFMPNAVPRVLGTDRASGSFFMEYLPADRYANWKTRLLTGEVDAEFAGQVGQALATIHSKTAHNDEIAGKFATDSNFYAIRLDPYLGETARVHPDLSDRLLHLLDRTATTKLALVQGDISPKNILCGPDGPVFIDAECSWYGDPAFDLAFCCNHMLLKAAHMPDKRADFLHAFNTLIRNYIAGITWEDPAEMERRTATLLPGLLLARVDGKSPVEYLTAPQRTAVRKASISLLKGSVANLSELGNHWNKELCA